MVEGHAVAARDSTAVRLHTAVRLAHLILDNELLDWVLKKQDSSAVAG